MAAAAGGRPVPLTWSGEKPATGLPAAARRARHALIADAARASGVAVVAFAHTADDVEEGEVMRGEGTPLGRLREWSPSPVWPEGRGVFLLRPLLGVRRERLRACLRSAGLCWLEDPSNGDLRFARARARAALQASPSRLSEGIEGEAVRVGAIAASNDDHGQPRSARPHPVAARPPSRQAGGTDGALVFGRSELDLPTLAAALLCVAGGARPPRSEALDRVLTGLDNSGEFAATLAGARLVASIDEVLVAREPGRRGLPAVDAEPGAEVVWDGRFLITPASPVQVRALAGHAARLSRRARAALKHLPPNVRPTLPILVSPDGAVVCPLLEDNPHRVRSLVGDRFAAAVGLIPDEAALTAASAAHGALGDRPLSC